jgi:hypothetical protein
MSCVASSWWASRTCVIDKPSHGTNNGRVLSVVQLSSPGAAATAASAYNVRRHQ